MSEIRALLFDVGGVLGTNGWDRDTRMEAARTFGFDAEAFERQHRALAHELETGRLGFEEYLEQSLFRTRRPFTPRDLKALVQERSRPDEGVLELARKLRATGRYLLGVLNNESAELNAYRLEKFRLKGTFDFFFSSCYLGLVKPDRAIYRCALAILQLEPDRAVFVDDRPENVAAARELGIRALEFHGTDRLRCELEGLGVRAD